MQDMVRVVVDAMGGDNAPGEIVKGAVEALNAREDIFIYLTGRKPVIEAELSKYTFPKERLEIVHTEEVIETAEPPVMAIRRKKDSSIVKGMNISFATRWATSAIVFLPSFVALISRNTISSAPCS